MKKIIVITAALFITSLAIFAQQKTGKKNTTSQITYTCPMHPEITSNKPGKCPKCGMALVEKKTYICPMHPDVVSDKPGKCAKCGMDLVEKKNASNKKDKM